MPTDEKPAASGSAVKEPRKTKSSDKTHETSTPGAQVAIEELTQAAEHELDSNPSEAGLEQDNAPPVTEKPEYKPSKQTVHTATEHHGSHASGKSIGKLMRFRRKRATRR